MIYKKEANFPYPLYTNTSTSYENPLFELNINLSENTDNYIFVIDYSISSRFICELLQQQKANIYLVIQTKDTKFYQLNRGESSVEIPKNRIALTKGRTTIQLLIRANDDISFASNYELSKFYDDYKDDIVIPKHSLLGYSNTVLFDGSLSKPYELFEKRLDPSMKSLIRIELGRETIILHYKHEDYQFVDSSFSGTLNNPYIYMGLQKALIQFIIKNGEDHESVDIETMEYPEDPLDCKLYNLMKAKNVGQVTLHNIDEVIHMISDHIIKKFTDTVRRMYK